MRIPIVFSDLIVNKGALDKVSSALRRSWPGIHSISIFEAKRIVATALGYISPNEMRVAAVNSGSNANKTPKYSVAKSLARVVSSRLEGSLPVSEPEQILNLVMALPLHLFSAIDDEQLSGDSGMTPHLATVRKHSHNSRILTSMEISAIADVVSHTANISDLLMFSLLNLGYKPTSIANARVNDDGFILIDTKPVHPSSIVDMHDNAELFNTLAAQRYLFPAPSDKSKPTTQARIARRFRNWVIKSGLGHDGITLHVFRRSVSAYRFKQMARELKLSTQS